MDFASWPMTTNLLIFVVASAFVWIAGDRLAGYADTVAVRTGLGQAFLGLLLLGVATSLPEIATTVTAALNDNPALVTGNLLGGVAMQIAILAIVDVALTRGPLTYFSPQPVLLFQGVMLVLLLALTIAGIAAGDTEVLGIGVVPVLLFAGYALTLRISYRQDYFPRWQATNMPPLSEGEGRRVASPEEKAISNGRLALSIGVAAAVILVAGWTLAQVGEALSEQTGLGASFVGFVLVAISTSLPELSTCWTAVRRGAYAMAVSNIFGTNCLEVGLFLLGDIVYQGGPILATATNFDVFAAALGMLVTTVYLVGLLERRDRQILRMGVDSVTVLVVYGIGVWVLYHMR